MSTYTFFYLYTLLLVKGSIDSLKSVHGGVPPFSKTTHAAAVVRKNNFSCVNAFWSISFGTILPLIPLFLINSLSEKAGNGFFFDTLFRKNIFNSYAAAYALSALLTACINFYGIYYLLYQIEGMCIHKHLIKHVSLLILGTGSVFGALCILNKGLFPLEAYPKDYTYADDVEDQPTVEFTVAIVSSLIGCMIQVYGGWGIYCLAHFFAPKGLIVTDTVARKWGRWSLDILSSWQMGVVYLIFFLGATVYLSAKEWIKEQQEKKKERIKQEQEKRKRQKYLDDHCLNEADEHDIMRRLRKTRALQSMGDFNPNGMKIPVNIFEKESVQKLFKKYPSIDPTLKKRLYILRWILSKQLVAIWFFHRQSKINYSIQNGWPSPLEDIKSNDIPYDQIRCSIQWEYFKDHLETTPQIFHNAEAYWNDLKQVVAFDENVQHIYQLLATVHPTNKVSFAERALKDLLKELKDIFFSPSDLGDMNTPGFPMVVVPTTSRMSFL